MKRRKVVKMSVDQIKERLGSLRSYLVMEKAGDNHPLYIQDLNDSISDAEKQLSFYKANPDDVALVK